MLGLPAMLDRYCRLASIWVAGTMLTLGADEARADMLPFVVDETRGGAIFWWSGNRSQALSEIDATLFSAPSHAIVPWASVQGLTISRIFQTPGLMPSHAQQIARMAGAKTYFLGVANAQSHSSTWVESSAAEVVIRGALYDTLSGSMIREAELVGHGVSGAEDGAIRLASRAAAKALTTFRPGAASSPSADTQIRVAIRSSGGASPYVALRDHIARDLLNIADVMECRASEGEVVLCVHGLPGQDLRSLRARVERLISTPSSLYVVDRSELEGLQMSVTIREIPAAHSDDRATFPR